MLRIVALLLGSGLALLAGPALALEVDVAQIDQNGDGSATYSFSVVANRGETVMPGADFVMIHNLRGIVEGSIKTPAGWKVLCQTAAATPQRNGPPAPSNLTWTVTAPVRGVTVVDGFSVTARAGTAGDIEYTAQATHSEQGVRSKQVIAGRIPVMRNVD
jgi:hypothetical protein